MKLFLSIACTLIFLEVALGLFWFKTDFLSEYRTITKKTYLNDNLTGKERREYDIKRHLMDLNKQSKIPHPFFGFVYNHLTNKSVNKDGFYDEVGFSDLKKSNDILTVGIFGGSLAKIFAKYVKYQQKEGKANFLQELEKRTGKKVRVLNFAITAYRQPQQFLVFSFFADKIDLSINIDGYNELTNYPSLSQNEWYPTYSDMFYHYRYEQYAVLAERYQLVKDNYAYTRFVEATPIINRSALVFLGWKTFQKLSARKMLSLVNPKEDLLFFPENRFTTTKARVEQIVDIWAKFTHLQMNLAASRKIKSLYFIQPNQYYKNSKPFSSEELAKYRNDKDKMIPIVTYGYDLFDQKMSKMQHAHSLKNLYKNVKETVYTDSCCHVNWHGNELIAQEVFAQAARLYQ